MTAKRETQRGRCLDSPQPSNTNGGRRKPCQEALGPRPEVQQADSLNPHHQNQVTENLSNPYSRRSASLKSKSVQDQECHTVCIDLRTYKNLTFGSEKGRSLHTDEETCLSPQTRNPNAVTEVVKETQITQKGVRSPRPKCNLSGSDEGASNLPTGEMLSQYLTTGH
jgi:hypothetical protein